ncbi:hypothetical protein AB6E26_25730 [Vibrio splendidus]
MAKQQFEPLFKSDSDWHNNACLNYHPDMSHGYINGYRLAADSLVLQVNETGRNQDYLVYPIVFLYRQHIELLLKNMVSNGRQFLDQKGSYPKHHKIDELWKTVKGILRKVFDCSIDKKFALVEHVVNELAHADPDSMSFRYSSDRNGKGSTDGIFYINLRHLGQMINETSEELDAADSLIMHYLEAGSDMHS